MIVAWQGLGYNRRAVSLHRAAQHVAEHGWPDDLTELPGVGPYTAAAVGNFAFGRDVLPVDTNVRARPGAHRRARSTAAARRRSSTSARRSASRASRAARVPARGRLPLARAALRAAAQTVARSRARSASGGRDALRAVAAGEQPTDGDALVSLERDGLVVLTTGPPSLPT